MNEKLHDLKKAAHELLIDYDSIQQGLSVVSESFREKLQAAVNTAWREHLLSRLTFIQESCALILRDLGVKSTEPSRSRRSRALIAIATERQRQKTAENWDDEHDDTHEDGQLALMAAYYAVPWQPQVQADNCDDTKPNRQLWPGDWERLLWPSQWLSAAAKKGKKSREQQLIVAGALIVAELDRLYRKDTNFT